MVSLGSDTEIMVHIFVRWTHIHLSYRSEQGPNVLVVLEMMNKINKSKAEKLYNEIESNPLFISPVMNEDRSLMNVPFVFSDEYEIKDNDFLEFCAKRGLMTLKGHRSVGGFRASIYNAMPESGVDMLIEAMRDFKKNIWSELFIK